MIPRPGNPELANASQYNRNRFLYFVKDDEATMDLEEMKTQVRTPAQINMEDLNFSSNDPSSRTYSQHD